ncbi:MAG TPA: hypothetical protein VHL80_07505, partial [Polyangia bacterium]|nr:hypothetical protein [Polyangia bacterium]
RRWPAGCSSDVAVRANLCPVKWRALAAAVALVPGACSTPSGAAKAAAAPVPAPASWQGPLADQMNLQALRPATPALRNLVGQAPLVYVARVAARGAHDEPSYELAIFDDGTLVYEGHRCVEIGGFVLARLGGDALTRLRDLLAALCSDLGGVLDDDALCASSATTRVACSDGERIQLGTDHCRAPGEAHAVRLEALVSGLAAQIDLDAWLGPPTRRQACTPGSRDLSPHELRKTLGADLARAGP